MSVYKEDNLILFNDDCIARMNKLIEQGIKVDLTVTSPPYDNLRSYNGNNELWNDSVWKGCLERLYKITADGGVVVWIVGDATIKGNETGTSFKQALYAKEIGFNLHDTMIWEKTGQGAVGSNLCYWQNFEYMFVFSKNKIKTFNPIIDRKNVISGEMKTSGGRGKDGFSKSKRSIITKEYGRRFNIWKINQQSHKEHKAVFPEQLANDHIISWSNEGDIVFDPFLGSGTTAKMAKINNRKFIGIELDEQYFNIAVDRIKNTEVGDK